ncbi:hypothetical protein [Tunicatimonas pelagia]|uniref:hypothetical protein n=1 Tax=Tunicatimonas pelagia TaxID=931531 RepID=UPI002666400D|nr:hypothetical protein [Tunicatimonas pelagia]WKN43285.1 hypothetical protein P0M28_30030 [Tunicatimonas pelagia]
MKICLKSYFLHDLMTLLEQQLGKDYLVHQQEILKISTPDYTSRFRALDFSQGLGCFYLDMQLEEDLEILFDIKRYHPLRFLYSLQGGFSHSGVSGRFQHQVKAGQFIAYACIQGQEQKVRFPGRQVVKCLGIQLIRQDFTQYWDISHLPSSIRTVIEDIQAKQPYLLHQTYASVIAPFLVDTIQNKKNGLSGNLLFEAKALEILAYQLEEYH